MPTTRPRHTITETPPVQEALDDLRTQLGSQKVDYAELLVLGARAKQRQLQSDSDAAQEARERLARDIFEGTYDPGDVAAADEVKRVGLIANYE
jgi:hypothetical protein